MQLSFYILKLKLVTVWLPVWCRVVDICTGYHLTAAAHSSCLGIFERPSVIQRISRTGSCAAVGHWPLTKSLKSRSTSWPPTIASMIAIFSCHRKLDDLFALFYIVTFV